MYLFRIGPHLHEIHLTVMREMAQYDRGMNEARKIRIFSAVLVLFVIAVCMLIVASNAGQFSLFHLQIFFVGYLFPSSNLLGDRINHILCIYFPSGNDEYCRLVLTLHNISFRGVGEISCRFPDLRGLKFGSFGTSRHFGSHSISEVPEAANFEFRPVPLDQREFASMASKSAWHGTGQRRKCRLFSLLNEVAILWIRFFRQ